MLKPVSLSNLQAYCCILTFILCVSFFFKIAIFRIILLQTILFYIIPQFPWHKFNLSIIIFANHAALAITLKKIPCLIVELPYILKILETFKVYNGYIEQSLSHSMYNCYKNLLVIFARMSCINYYRLTYIRYFPCKSKNGQQ